MKTTIIEPHKYKQLKNKKKYMKKVLLMMVGTVAGVTNVMAQNYQDRYGSDSGNSNMWPIVALILGILAIVGLIWLLIWLMMRHAAVPGHDARVPIEVHVNSHNGTNVGTDTTVSTQGAITVPFTAEVEIPVQKAKVTGTQTITSITPVPTVQ